MKAQVTWTDETNPSTVANCPGQIWLGIAPPDDIVLLIPLPNGANARVQVDCHEFDMVLDRAHDKLVEAAADAFEKEVADDVAPAVPAPVPALPPVSVDAPAAVARNVGSVPAAEIDTPTVELPDEDEEDEPPRPASPGKPSGGTTKPKGKAR